MKIVFATFVALSAAVAAQAQVADPAAAFGVRESVQSIALSPDGRTIAYVAPAPAGQGALLFTAALGSDATPRVAARADGVEQRLGRCDFVSSRRLVCLIHVVQRVENVLIPISRLVALDADGGNMRVLGQRDTADQVAGRAWSGEILDLLPGEDNAVLMAQLFIPESRTGTRMVRTGDGLGVVRVDTTNLRTSVAEQPRPEVSDYISDGRGRVRIMASRTVPDFDRLDD